MIKPGMFIADRYEIIDSVGSGGMADVYKARCHKLNRFVAIKVLKEEFSTDEVFVEKFRAEAQSAAGLQHTNIVNIYDVGEENGIYYIVMELIEGITLKNFIERKGRLDVREATGIAIQIASGLEAAHANNIIHRDIKPQNIIISRDGKVKVADFGIAKAASSNTLTSSAMGSVHYISPEQARGGYSDEKSDIYSLGITMYEMILGKVPFEGDNAVSIALLHIQEEIPPLADLVGDVPVSTNKIVIKCLQKKPERRYLSVMELISDLKRSLVEPNVDFVIIPDVLTNSPTIALSPNDVNAIRNGIMPNSTGTIPPMGQNNNDMMNNQQPMMSQPNGMNQNRDGNYQHFGQQGYQNQEMDYNDEFVDPDEEKVDVKLEKITKVGGVIIIALIIAIIGFMIVSGTNKREEKPTVSSEPEATIPATLPPGTTVEVSDVIGKKEDKAREILEAQGLIVSVRYVAPPEGKEQYEGIVKDQQPAAGTQYPVNTAVTIVVYKKGADPETELEKEEGTMPDLVGMTTDIASAKLYGLFKVISLDIKYETINDDGIEIGSIVKTKPIAGEKITNTSKIIIYISAGPDNKVTVPSLIGKSLKDAERILETAGLELGNIKYASRTDRTNGTVLEQSQVAYNIIDRGSKIDVTVNKVEEQTPEPTEAPKKEYQVIVVYGGSTSSLFAEDAPDDAEIILTGRVRYKGQTYTGKGKMRKGTYVEGEGIQVLISIETSDELKDSDIEALDTVTIEGAAPPGAVASPTGCTVLNEG